MNPDFAPAAPGGETGCAATVVAAFAGAVDSFRRARGNVAADSTWILAAVARRPAARHRYVMCLPLTGCGDLDLLPVGDGAHPDSGPNRDPADGPCGHDDRGVNHA